MEIQNTKKSSLNKHARAINTELYDNTVWVQRALNFSSQVIKNGSLNTQQRYHYDHLQRHLISDTNINDDYINGIHSSLSDEDSDKLTNDNDIDVNNFITCGKRLRLEEYDLEDCDDILGCSTDDDGAGDSVDIPTTSKKPRHLDESHALNEFANNPNATFYVAPSSSSKTNTVLASLKSNLVSNIISDQIIKAPSNADQLKNALIKSKKFTHSNVIRTVAAGIQKENKKFSPNRIRKSPRNVVTKAASSLVKQRQATRMANIGTDVPIVRINRAASFRVKK